MENESTEYVSSEKGARWAIVAIALVLIGIEIAQILDDYRIVDTYARPDQTRNFDAVDRMAAAHGIRIALVATLFTGWRWSLWLTAFSFVVVYVPNPWISGKFMNSISFALFLIPLIMVAQFFDKRLLYPWRFLPAQSPG